ncbi:STAS domain-containing protein [Dechloromonas sp. ZY10]|uniref:STAS domain-containing protein n=1 Tax=Dechloromonas aquae TaxID=2664436 RepID=UPI003528A459
MSDVSRITITEDLTIYNALELKQRLTEAVEQGSALELDLSHVAEIDTAGLQLLILARREAGKQNKPMLICAMSDNVRQTVEFCNLTRYLGEAAAISEAPTA